MPRIELLAADTWTELASTGDWRRVRLTLGRMTVEGWFRNTAEAPPVSRGLVTTRPLTIEGMTIPTGTPGFDYPGRRVLFLSAENGVVEIGAPLDLVTDDAVRDDPTRIADGFVGTLSGPGARLSRCGSESMNPAARAAPPALGVRHGLDRNVLRAHIVPHAAEVQRCYQEGVDRNPGLGGRLVTSFVVTPDGSPAAVSIADDTLGDLAVAECIARQVWTWQFPPPEGGGIVVVNYPWSLVPAR